MKIHERNDYETPQMSVFLWEEEDVITVSGDTDVSFGSASLQEMSI